MFDHPTDSSINGSYEAQPNHPRRRLKLLDLGRKWNVEITIYGNPDVAPDVAIQQKQEGRRLDARKSSWSLRMT